jgi:hypothetical protein
VVGWVALLVTAVASAEPSLKVTRPEGPARLHEPYEVVLTVSWPGDPAEYVVLPAQVESLDWGRVNVERAESVVQSGINSVSQTVSIVAHESGAFEVPEILIAYRHPEDLTPPETAAAPATNPKGPGVDPTLRARPFILHVKPDRTLAWVFGGLGALLLCLMLGWWFARKRRPPAGHLSSPASPGPEELLQEAARRRLDGQPYEYYLALTRALEVCPDESQLFNELSIRAQQAGYQGVRPSDEQMQADYDAVARALERR